MAEITPANQVEVLGNQIKIPTKDAFGTEPFKSAPDLNALGAALIAKHPDRLKAAGKAEIRYLWKANGGSQYGKPNYGTCEKTSGLVHHFAGCDFVVWFAADHLAETAFMQAQLEALMFRCLCHVGVNENTKSFQFIGPDFHGYADEVRLYGLWDQPLRELGQAMRQMPLFETAGDDYTEPPANISRFPHTEADAAAEGLVRSRGRRGGARTNMADGPGEMEPGEEAAAMPLEEAGAEAGELVGTGAE